MSNLAQVLTRLGTAGMRLKREKCAFMLDRVSYLGHVISSEGLRTGDLKVKASVDAPDPLGTTLIFRHGKLLWEVFAESCDDSVSTVSSTPTVYSLALGAKVEKGFPPCQEAAAVQPSSVAF